MADVSIVGGQKMAVDKMSSWINVLATKLSENLTVSSKKVVLADFPKKLKCNEDGTTSISPEFFVI